MVFLSERGQREAAADFPALQTANSSVRSACAFYLPDAASGFTLPQSGLLKTDWDSMVYSTGVQTDPVRMEPTKCTLPAAYPRFAQVVSAVPLPAIEPPQLHSASTPFAFFQMFVTRHCSPIGLG